MEAKMFITKCRSAVTTVNVENARSHLTYV